MRDLFTIGYEGTSQAAFLAALLDADIEILIDIRETPLSRKPGFSKKSLGAGVSSVGIEYLHIRELGTPRDIRYRRKIDHDQAAFTQSYLEHLAKQDDAMNTLVMKALERRCCLLCFEADAAICHRRMVGERAFELSEGKLQIVDLESSSFHVKSAASLIPIGEPIPEHGSGPGAAL